MNCQQYKCKIHEVHHTEKLDAPSGTAKTLVLDIEKIQKKLVEITADRMKDVAGTHSVTYSSIVDEIEIKHTAKNREGFARGALLAAEWIIGKKGVFSMKDVLDIQ